MHVNSINAKKKRLNFVGEVTFSQDKIELKGSLEKTNPKSKYGPISTLEHLLGMECSSHPCYSSTRKRTGGFNLGDKGL